MSVDALVANLQNQFPNLKKNKLASPSQNVQGTNFQAMIEEQQNFKKEILEKGFGTVIKEQQQEKLEEEIKAKILSALGLSEEQFNALPAAQKAAIEQAIKEAMQQEMLNRSREHAEEEGTGKPANLSIPMIAGLSL